MTYLQEFLMVFIASMIPAVEVKAAVPFGIALGLQPVISFAIAIMGSTIIVIFLAFFTNWFYRYCKRKHYMKRFIGWMDKIANKNSGRLKKFGPLAIFIYVAVPIPGTGTWTGSIIAGVLNIPPGKIILAVILGNLVAGTIVMMAGTGIASVLERFIQ